MSEMLSITPPSPPLRDPVVITAFRGWNDAATARLRQRLEDGGIGHRREIATFFDLIEVDEGRAPRQPLW